MPGDDRFRTLIDQRRRDRGFRASILLFSVLLLMVLLVVWAANAKIDDVTRTDGQVVPSSSLRVLQAPQGGTVESVLVSEGDLVEPGQLLMAMDRTRFGGHLDQERQLAFALRARLARLQSEVGGTALVFPAEVEAEAPGIAASERDLFAARRVELVAEIDVLTLQLDQQREALIESESLRLSAEATHGLVTEQIATIEPLVRRGLEPRTSLLQLQIQLSEWGGRLAQASARLAQERSRLTEIEKRIVARKNQFRSDALEELSRTVGELAGLAPAFPVLEQRLRETEIRAPVRGVINQLFVSNVGGVVGTGADLVEIVPVDDVPIVEAFVQPADIAFLRVGQPVNVKITAYDFSRYGALAGEIRRIGASPVRHPERDASVFAIEVVTSSLLEDAVGAPLPVVPGMIAEVEFVSEQKTVLDYITRPVVRVRDRAFRD